MMRLLVAVAMQLVANAIALIVAALILDDMALDVPGFVLAVALFTGISALIQPMIRQMAFKRSPALLGSSALVVSLLALIGTAILSDGLRISGLTTWILAAVIVWAGALIATLLLPVFVFKRLREERTT